MMPLKKLLKSKFVREEHASTAVEYSVMVALIIVTCIGAIRGIGGENGSLWTSSVETIESEFAASGS